MKKLIWNEPSSDGDTTCSCTEQEAINQQREYVARVRPDFQYLSDQDALDDFITSNWAWWVED